MNKKDLALLDFLSPSPPSCDDVEHYYVINICFYCLVNKKLKSIAVSMYGSNLLHPHPPLLSFPYFYDRL